MDAGVRVVFLDGEWSPEISGACAEVVGVRCVSQGDEIESDRIRSGDLVFFDFVSSESVELVRELRQKVEGVKAVVVAEGFRSRGVGAILFDYAKNLAVKKACVSIGLDAFTYNHAAHKFFFKEDFVVKGYHFVHEIEENLG